MRADPGGADDQLPLQPFDLPRPPAGLGGVMTLSVAVPGSGPIEMALLMDSGELAK